MSKRKGNLRNEGERTGRPIRRIREWKAERQRSVWGGGGGGWQMFEFSAKREKQRSMSWVAKALTGVCCTNESVRGKNW